jgi:O-antigen/teichoic acid export membrane protein
MEMETSAPQTGAATAQAATPQRWSGFGSQVAVTLTTNLFLSALGLCSGVLTARYLGPAGRGELEAILLWGAFVATVALLGLADAVTYFTSREPRRAGHYWIVGLGCALVCGLPVLLLSNWLVLLMLQGQSATVTSTMTWFPASFFFLFTLISLSLGVLRGMGDFIAWNKLRMLPQLGWIVAVVTLCLLQKSSPFLLALGFLGAYAVATVVVVIQLVRRLTLSFSHGERVWLQMLQYGVPAVASSMPTHLLQSGRLVQLFIAFYLDPAALGILAVGVALGDVMRVIPGAIAAVVFPRVAGAQGDQQLSELTRGTRVTVILTSICVLGAVLVSPIMVPFLFGEQFKAAVYLSMLMAVAGGIDGLKVVLGSSVRGLGQPAALITSEALAVGTTAGCLILFLPSGGVNSAALAIIIGNVTGTLFLVHVAKRIAHCSLRRLLFPTSTDLQQLRTSMVREWGAMLRPGAARP